MQHEYREVKIQEAVRIVSSDPVGTYYVAYCTNCGVPVYNREIHDGWHERNDEYERPIERERRPMLGPNSGLEL